MHYCDSCENKLKDAKYLWINERIYKSCPACSNNAGEDIFYRCPEDFGTTKKRISSNNPAGLQSYCSKCRSNKQGPHENAITCSELSSKNGVVISEIRFLPMSKDIFPTYEDAKEFILYEMPNRGNIYYYMKSKMDCKDNAFILFQHAGTLIGYAIFDKMIALDEPINVDDAIYTGYYVFKSGSIRLFKNPITADMFSKIDPMFKAFSQSHQIKPVGILPTIFKVIEDGEGSIRPNDNITSLPEEIDEQEGKGLKEGHKKQIIVNAYERNLF